MIVDAQTPQKGKRRESRALLLLMASLIAVLLAAVMLDWRSKNSPTIFPTPYQAVLLSNGAVYYGKLQGYGTPHPVLTEVFYIVARTDPKTNASSNILVKRGKELHEPDRMYLNPNSVVFVETVGRTSKVAQLISEANGK
jgi:hypothetical protein